ncbi:hypothetical protein [Zavarzinella formosa]|uniref:hypothetical protein n=1 Tax=Zavarzinella formosa TaxID=360055 RepID=UPI0002FCB46C|nr:hypothetical protein [Zavarzinella formosa]
MAFHMFIPALIVGGRTLAQWLKSRPSRSPEQIHYQWIPILVHEADRFARETPDMTTLKIFREALISHGDRGRLVWNSLAGDLQRIDEAHPNHIIFVRLT